MLPLGVGIYDLFCHIPLVVVGVGDVDGQVEVAHLQVFRSRW